LRILQLLNRFEPGGAERVLADLSVTLAQRGHAIHVVCLREPDLIPAPLERLRSAGVHLTVLNKPDGFSTKAMKDLAGYARQHRIEVIHGHNPLVNHYAVLAARAAGVGAVVNTLHGTSTLGMPAWAKAIYICSCLKTNRVVAVCEAVAQVFREKFPLSRGRTVVVPNGIDAGDLLTIEPRRADSRFVFGTMSRLVPVKDHHSLLKAFAAIHGRYPHCRLAILGSGELDQQLKSAASQLGVSDAVSFLGWSSDIAGFLGQLDTFVLSSLSEGLPLTLLEAMAAGLPVVATSVGGVPEIVRAADCGWLCPPGEPARLAERMTLALEADDRLLRGRRGRAAVQSEYSLETMTDRYEELFEGLLGGAPERLAARRRDRLALSGETTSEDHIAKP